MKKVFAVTAAIVLLSMGLAAQANVFNLGSGFTNLETVTVGDPGNAGQVSGARVCGSVSYTYNIGKYEVTAKQYADFLNNKAKYADEPHGLYAGAGSIQRSGGGTVIDPYVYTVANDRANRPVTHVSFWDACRFVNWLGNGQGSGDTETGAYTLTGCNEADGRTIRRNAGAKWAVTNEDEWYKAAYYKGGGPNAGYWLFPTRSNSAPSSVGSDGYTDPGNHANYLAYPYSYTIGAPYYTTQVGEFENSASAYGTFDQGGNVWEWNETLFYGLDANMRGLRGSSFNLYDSNMIASDRSSGGGPTYETSFLGFRVSQVTPVPEPSSLIALAGGLISLLGIRRRRA